MEEYIEQVGNNFCLEKGGYISVIDGRHRRTEFRETSEISCIEWTKGYLHGIRSNSRDVGALRSCELVKLSLISKNRFTVVFKDKNN